MPDSSKLSSTAEKFARSELTQGEVYRRLAKAEGTHHKELSDALYKMAESEQKHYEFWQRYNPTKASPEMTRVRILWLLKLLLGTTFAVKFMEKQEGSIIKRYKAFEPEIPEADRAQFNEIIADEEVHEKSASTTVKGTYIRYISFIILGLADAIVEISGIHAGSLGIYKSTELTGLAGIVAGGAASIAMASAAYAQAKQGFEGRAGYSAVFTGVSYFINAVILATPYFLTHTQIVAFSASIIAALVIIAFTSYFNSVVSDSRFLRDFAELAVIMLGASAVLYIFGLFIGSALGVGAASA